MRNFVRLNAGVLLYTLCFALSILGTNALANNLALEHCGTAKNELLIGYDLVAVTDSKYIRLAFDINTPPKSLMYVMSRKPPYSGKAYFLEFMSTACRTLSLHLRNDDGATAFITFSTQGPNCEPCMIGAGAQIIWGDPKVPGNLESDVSFGFAGSTGNYFGSPQKINVNSSGSQGSELKTVILAASQSICQIAYDTNKGDKFDNCVAHRSGLYAEGFEQKYGVTP